VRTPPALTLVLAALGTACGTADRREAAAAHDTPSATPIVSQGPDAVLLRIPRGGGPARASVYPRLDSIVWRSVESVPALSRVLAFDQDLGLLAYADAKGLPGRLDLRLGDVQNASKTRFASLSSADASGIYGVSDGVVTRLTPTDARPWRYTPPTKAREVFPEPDGSVVVAAERPNATVVWRMRPPDTTLVDSVLLPATERGVRTPVGDRIYFTAANGKLITLRSREFEPAPAVDFPVAVRSVAPTPSGDRVYVTTDTGRRIAVIDRYTDRAEGAILLPGEVSDLRMDPLGRYLLARPTNGDSAWVIAVGTGRVIGSVRTRWLPDLPLVTPDGAVALADSTDVTLVDGETLKPRSTVRGGAKDFWYFVLWNGFRPRAAGIDQPVTFQTQTRDSSGDSAAVAGGEGSAAPGGDTATVATKPSGSASARDTLRAATPAAGPPRQATPQRPPPAAAPQGFVVQFAAVRTADAARAASAPIVVNGQRPHVITTQTDGTTIYRVVLGPYSSRADAERVGRASGRDYWVYEGLP
jgi:cell division septation protein DedD